MLHKAALLLLFSMPALAPLPAGSGIRLIRSLSGPSGKVVGSKFVLDEIRNRFVYPLDGSLTVSFECQASKGDYVLTAYWKDPEGKTAAISPDLKIKTENNDLNSYWIFMIDPYKANGIWTVEVRVNGEPVGSHSFELVMPEPARSPSASGMPAEPTMDELYRNAGQSLVWVYKLDNTGHRIDTSSGFVVAADGILTAFQSIDTAAKIEIEFANGAKIQTDEIIACSRFEDWALVKAKTGDVPPLKFGQPDSIKVGEDAIVFGIGTGNTRTIGTVDISGRKETPRFGKRIHIDPQLPPQAVGGPLLDYFGNVAGVIGGSLTPGIRFNRLREAVDGTLAYGTGYLVTVSPIDASVLKTLSPAKTLKELQSSRILTAPLLKIPVLKSGTVTDKVAADFKYASKTRFSRKDAEIVVCTIWEHRGEINQGVVTANVYDAANTARFKPEPHRLRLLPNELIQNLYKFSPRNLEPGPYRIDLFWNGLPVWRAFISITD